MAAARWGSGEKRLRGVERFAGESEKVSELRRMIKLAGEREFPCLVSGETGTGKELAARGVHEESGRKGQVLRAVNCGGLAEEVLESELMGHVRGAYTGAVGSRGGAFRAAEGSTLFLDEVSDLSRRGQAGLLRVLEEGEVKPVGGDRIVTVDVRIVAATNKVLEREVDAGRFRRDLYFRLAAIEIKVPPLRERREDIAVLAQTEWRRVNLDQPRSEVAVLGKETVEALAAYDWPGNVRELQNVLAQVSLMARGKETVERDALPERVRRAAGRARPTLAELQEAMERKAIGDALGRSGGELRGAAKELGISQVSLSRMAERFARGREEPGRER